MGDVPKPKRYWAVEGALEDSDNPDTYETVCVEAADEDEAMQLAQPRLAAGYGRLGKLEYSAEEISAEEAYEYSGGEVGAEPDPENVDEETEDPGLALRVRCDGDTPVAHSVSVEGTTVYLKVWRQQRIVELLLDDEERLAIGERTPEGSPGELILYEEHRPKLIRLAVDVWKDDELFAELLS